VNVHEILRLRKGDEVTVSVIVRTEPINQFSPDDSVSVTVRMSLERLDRVIAALEGQVGNAPSTMHKGFQYPAGIVGPVPSLDQARLLSQILTERRQQDAQWGGTAHDDSNTVADWARFIGRQMNALLDTTRKDVPISMTELGTRNSRFIKIAALCMAALESYGRQGWKEL
jgi:hypothetical protein